MPSEHPDPAELKDAFCRTFVGGLLVVTVEFKSLLERATIY